MVLVYRFACDRAARAGYVSVFVVQLTSLVDKKLERGVTWSCAKNSI